jgi:hypothetical protein
MTDDQKNRCVASAGADGAGKVSQPAHRDGNGEGPASGSQSEAKPSSCGGQKAGVSKPEDFRKRFIGSAETYLVQLPSGLTVRLRPLSLVARGLALDEAARAKAPGATPEQTQEYGRTVMSAACEILVEPRLSLRPQAGEIHPNWLSLEDLLFIFNWGCGTLPESPVAAIPIPQAKGRVV